MAVRGAARRIREVLAGWDGVKPLPHRFGGEEYRLGRREIGHAHGDALVDVPLPRSVRDQILAAGLAERHHILPASGWVSIWLREAADVERALAVLRRAYELAQEQRARNAAAPDRRAIAVE